MAITPKDVSAFRRKIFAWWQSNRRDLPWRHTRDPYRILVSEVMLQQTQVARVIPKYKEFLEAFPDVHALSAASPARVLTLWRGMGYNRRALYLKRTAETVVQNYDGAFPDTDAELMKLPGLGIYTARAILVFAFGKDTAMVDTNIRKIITHFFYDGKQQKEKRIRETADLLVPAGKSWEWHQALMDFGALELGKIRPKISRRTKTVPFKESDRYFRGRIVDALRSGSTGKKGLIASLVKHYGRSPAFYERLISGLEKDGLVAEKRGRIELPG